MNPFTYFTALSISLLLLESPARPSDVPPLLLFASTTPFAINLPDEVCVHCLDEHCVDLQRKRINTLRPNKKLLRWRSRIFVLQHQLREVVLIHSSCRSARVTFLDERLRRACVSQT